MNPSKLLLINEICAYIEAGLSYDLAVTAALDDYNRDHVIRTELQSDTREAKETCGGPGA